MKKIKKQLFIDGIRSILFAIILVFLLNRCGSPKTELEILSHLKLDSIKNQIIAGYKDTIKVDTTFISNMGDTVVFKLRHYCTFDNKVSTPPKYLDIYKLSRFQTHNFVSNIEYKINSKTIFKGLITKADFKNLISYELKKYGVLQCSPVDINVYSGSFSIEYGIVIPLANLGGGIIHDIDSTGKKKFGQMD